MAGGVIGLSLLLNCLVVGVEARRRDDGVILINQICLGGREREKTRTGFGRWENRTDPLGMDRGLARKLPEGGGSR